MSTLKEALVECLEGSLSPEGDIRKGAEERLKALEVTETYPIHLMEIVLQNAEPVLPPPLRQLASVILRQYVDTHWTSLAEKFVPPEPTEEVKTALKSMLPIGLTYSESKIRNSIAAIISNIAHWDWPETWAGLFEIIVQYLRTENGVNGAMRVLSEFAKELTEDQVIQVAPIILPEMYNLITRHEAYSSYTRARAVQVFRVCVRVITLVGHVDENVPAKILDPVIPNYITALVAALSEPENPGHFKLKKEVVKTFNILIQYYQDKVSPYFSMILQPTWAILTSITEHFQEALVGNLDEDVDSDGEKSGINAVLFAIFELVQILLEGSSEAAKKFIVESLTELIFFSIFYMQLSQDKVEQYLHDPSAFAADEDEEYATFSLRTCGQDLLTVVFDAFEQQSIVAVGEAVNRHLNTHAGQTDWRLQEACLYAVCSLGTNVAKPPSGPNAPPSGYFNIAGFIQNVVIPGLSSQDELLVGRCLILGSNFCSVISPDVVEHFIRATAECLQPDRSMILKILATKAMASFVSQSTENENLKKQLLFVLTNVVDSLVTFVTMCSSVEILTIVLDTLTEILKLDEQLTASVGQKITTLSIACFVKFNSDPAICPIIEGILQILSKNRNCVVGLQERLTPTLVSVLNQNGANTGGPQAVALDLLTVVVRGSPVPLANVLISSAFPAVINCVTKSDDHSVWQNGGECLRAYTSVAPDQVYEYRDVNGVSGLGYVVQVACRLLDPSTSEFSASLVGKLVTTLLYRTGDKLGDQLELLLRAVLSKLRSADTLSVIQNLLMVYAFLFNSQMEPTLNFLDSVPGPTGESALVFVMTEWVSRQHLFYGMFDRKVSAIALCTLLHHGVTSQDPRLMPIEVKGEIKNPGKQMVTRSKKSTEEWTRVPLLVKIFKLLIYELSCVTTEEEAGTESDSDEEDKENGGAVDIEDLLFNEEESGLNTEDQDVLTHPLYAVDLTQYLKDFIMAFCAQPYFPEFVPHLNHQEKKVLCKIGLLPSS